MTESERLVRLALVRRIDECGELHKRIADLEERLRRCSEAWNLEAHKNAALEAELAALQQWRPPLEGVYVWESDAHMERIEVEQNGERLIVWGYDTEEEFSVSVLLLDYLRLCRRFTPSTVKE